MLDFCRAGHASYVFHRLITPCGFTYAPRVNVAFFQPLFHASLPFSVSANYDVGAHVTFYVDELTSELGACDIATLS